MSTNRNVPDHGSAVKRTKWRGLIRNACIALANSMSSSFPNSPTSSASPTSSTSSPSSSASRVVSLLERLATSDDSAIADAARWALKH